MNKDEAVEHFIIEAFSEVPSYLLFDPPDWTDRISIYEYVEEDPYTGESIDEIENTDRIPDINTIWLPNDRYSTRMRIEPILDEVARLGFSYLIYNGDYFLGLGLDSLAITAHFKWLYETLGYTWHSED